MCQILLIRKELPKMLRLLQTTGCFFLSSSALGTQSQNSLLQYCSNHKIISSLKNRYSSQIIPSTPITTLKKKHPLPLYPSCRRLNYVIASYSTISESMLKSESGEDTQYSKAGLHRNSMPKHMAIILDGSRRWHKAQGKPLDYRPFFKANMLFADLCLKWGIGTATSFIYGVETLGRDNETNDLLFRRFQTWLEDNLEDFTRKRIRVSIIGERYLLPESLHTIIKQVEEATANYSNLEFLLAICYSGRKDIVEATRSICKKVKIGEIEPESVDEALIEQELSTKTLHNPHPDLMLRTGGDLFLSNFLMWQLAQTELYFTNIYGPDFGEADFVEALRSFQQRERAFDK